RLSSAFRSRLAAAALLLASVPPGLAQAGRSGGGGGGFPTSHRFHGLSDSPTAAFIAIFIPLVLVLVMYAFAKRAERRPRPRIRILATPAGEAPEDVRQAWVGLEIPLSPGETKARRIPAVEVLSNQPARSQAYFLVPALEAIARLEAADARAAAWWKDKGPKVLVPGYQLAFPEEACEHWRLGGRITRCREPARRLRSRNGDALVDRHVTAGVGKTGAGAGG